jgi:hypothetical protein
LGEIACGLCLRHGGNGSFALTGKDSDVLLLGLHRCRRRRHARLGSRSRRVAFIDLGLGISSGLVGTMPNWTHLIDISRVPLPPGSPSPNCGRPSLNILSLRKGPAATSYSLPRLFLLTTAPGRSMLSQSAG